MYSKKICLIELIITQWIGNWKYRTLRSMSNASLHWIIIYWEISGSSAWHNAQKLRHYSNLPNVRLSTEPHLVSCKEGPVKGLRVFTFFISLYFNKYLRSLQREHTVVYILNQYELKHMLNALNMDGKINWNHFLSLGSIWKKTALFP